MRTREGLPGRSPIAPSQARLTLELFCDGLPEKKLQLVDMSILINPIKPWAGMSQRRTSIASLPPHAALSELSSYLDSDCVVQYDEDFNILNWWHEHKRIYPILSILAKDVLIVPASTISSESTFSLAGRVLEER
jgi:hypothetical protein